MTLPGLLRLLRFLKTILRFVRALGVTARPGPFQLPSLPVSVVQVEFIDEFHVAVILSGDVTFSDLSAAFLGFSVAGAATISVDAITPSQYVVENADGISIGDPWLWASDAGKAAPPIDLPANGLVIFAG